MEKPGGRCVLKKHARMALLSPHLCNVSTQILQCQSVKMVYVNNKKMTPVYTNADFTITTTGIAMTLDIPAIKAQVTFKGMFFLVSIPFSQFHNNTEGQCEPKNVCVFSENVYLGFSYEDVPGKCCGNCVQKQCVYQDADQSNKITTAEVGQSWTHPSKPCVTFNCTKVNNVFVLVKIPPSCPEYNPQDCIPGTEQITSDGCCKTCQLHKCNLKKNTTYLEINDCTSIQPVEIASCSGSCDTKSIYSMAANTMMHHCTCCKELRTSSKKVQLRCANNTLKPYTYTYVEECGCHITNCTD
ncbi:hypothetical protein QTP86_009882 [Hemibagrus guttatus]|nr:hypothetical protein QTP86_009882 [Hemibagrus guttatus]